MQFYIQFVYQSQFRPPCHYMHMIEEQFEHHLTDDLKGSPQCPISILDDHEEKDLHDRLLEESRNQAILKQALLCRNSIDVTFAIIKTKFRGTFKHKEDSLKRQIACYFGEKMNLDILNDYFCKRIEADGEEEANKPIGIALIVYGVDFMNTKRVGGIFSTPEGDLRQFINKIQWIDASSCKVVFFSPQNTQLALESLVLNKAQYKTKVEEEGSIQLPRNWFQLKPYDIFGIERKLFARYASQAELEAPKRDEQINRYVIFQNAQRSLEMHLLAKFNAFQQYQQVTGLMQFQSYRNSIFRRVNHTPKIIRDLSDTKRFQEYVHQSKQGQEVGSGMNRNPFAPRQSQFQRNPMNVSLVEPNSLLENVRKDNHNQLDESLVLHSAGGQSSEEREVNKSFLRELNQEEKAVVAEGQDRSVIMIDESEQSELVEKPQQSNQTKTMPAQVTMPISASQLSNPSQIYQNLANKDVVNMLAGNPLSAAHPAPDRSDKNKLSSQQVSISLSESASANQRQQNALTKPTSIKPAESENKQLQKQVQSSQKYQSNYSPSQNQVQNMSGAGNNIPQKFNQGVKQVSSTVNPGKSRVLQLPSRPVHEQPDSY